MMPKLDEQADVPALDAATLERLARALDRERVVAATLFGSQARGAAGPLSDVDVAVWLEPGVAAGERAQMRLELADAAASALGSGEVDLVVLNDTPPLLIERLERVRERGEAA